MKTSILFCLLLGVAASAQASWTDNFGLRGYVREEPILWKPPTYFGGAGDYRLNNLIHARQNLRWYPTYSLRAGVDLKTRLFAGKSAGLLQSETNSTQFGATYVNLTHAFFNDNDFTLTSTIDRAWVDWTAGPVETTIGRQRIAWGTSLVWNPIDLFNPSSPLDFDNEELPGTDAARVQWYFGPSSKLEAAVSPQKDADKTVAAIELLVNKWEYDWIILAGRRHSQAVIGAAWAGSILKGGFRGELLYAIPRSSSEDPYLTATIGGDYTFRNTLYLHAVVLYNERGTTGNAGGIKLIESIQRGELTSSRMNFFAEIARDLNPLLRGDLMGILNPYDGSWYLGPSLTWSVITNLDLTGLALVFGGDTLTEYGDNGEIFLARLKYSF